MDIFMGVLTILNVITILMFDSYEMILLYYIGLKIIINPIIVSILDM